MHKLLRPVLAGWSLAALATTAAAFPVTLNSGETVGFNYSVPVGATGPFLVLSWNAVAGNDSFTNDFVFDVYEDVDLQNFLFTLTSPNLPALSVAADDGAFSIGIKNVSSGVETLASNSISLASDGQTYLLTGVRVDGGAIPEPGTLALLASGLLIAGAVRRRRA